MPVVLKNNASGYLLTPISSTDVGLALETGDGNNFPTLGANEYFYATLVASDGETEVVKVTARVGDAMTIVRAQDDTPGASFAAGSRLEMRVNAAAVRDAASDAVTSTLSAADVTVTDSGGNFEGTTVEEVLAELADAATIQIADTSNYYVGTTVEEALKEAAQASTTQITDSGGYFTGTSVEAALQEAGADVVSLEAQIQYLANAFNFIAQVPVGMIAMWSGSVASIPTASGWYLCDGNNGTPDLRDRFIVGAGNTYAVGATGGGTTKTTSTGGSHSHTIEVGLHVLSVAEMPTHGHPWYGLSNSQSAVADAQQSDASILTGVGTDIVRDAYTGAPSTNTGQQIGGTGGGQAHTHENSAATSGGSHSHTVDVRPSYYALAYIMYTGA